MEESGWGLSAVYLVLVELKLKWIIMNMVGTHEC